MPNEAQNFSSFTQAEIRALFKKARMRVRTCGVRILTAQARGSWGKILIITPRKSGSAPERNLFKRRIRSIFREDRIFEKKIDCIIITNKEGTGLSFKRLKEIFIRAITSHC